MSLTILVGAGRGQRMGADIVVRGPGGHRGGTPQREPLEELGVGRDEVESDRVGGVVGDDPAREVTARGVRHARRATEESLVIGIGLTCEGVRYWAQPEIAFDRAAEVLGLDRLAV